MESDSISYQGPTREAAMTADTEEIIDLTDLIEEGEPSATTSRPSAEKDSL